MKSQQTESKRQLTILKASQFMRDRQENHTWPVKCVLAGLTVWFVALLLPSHATAQAGRLPKIQFYNNAVFRQYYLGDYKDAARAFSRGENSAFKFGTRRHLDSICFWTMLGECNYHTGNYAQAINYYEQALRLYLSYQAEDWQSRVQLPALIQARNNALQSTNINWGTPRRRARYAEMPDSFSMMFGRLDAVRAFQEGGVFDQAQVYQVDVTEIMRCTALCLHRRRVIKGPISKTDPFTRELITGLRVPNAGNNSVLGALNGVLLGIAQASAEDWDDAARTLKSSLQISGMDHPLTPVALLELANIGLVTENYTVATELALEASFAAAIYRQHDLIEEALGLGTQLHLMTAKTPYAPLENAIVWARVQDARLMQASLIVKLAECLAEGGQTQAAAKVLAEVNRVINNRNSLGSSVANARAKYVGALIQFLEGNFAAGQVALTATLRDFQTGSLWLYRLGLADQLVANRAIEQRQADLLYTALLRDPSEADWRLDPLECIAFLASPHVGAMERWFEIVVDRKDNRRALEIAELVRRHRFFSSLPMGGRLMAFRWVLHAPEAALSPAALGQRQQFLAANPNYQQSIARADQIRTSLLLLPINPEPRTEDAKAQLDLMEELATISSLQESTLASFALRRQPAEMAFPPQAPVSDLQANIAEDQLALVTLATANGHHVFLVNEQAVKYVGLFSNRNMLRSVAGLLKEMGISDPVIDIETLQSEEWKAKAEDIKATLFAGESDESFKKFRELVVVPDGLIWYLPFEAFPVDVKLEKKPAKLDEEADKGGDDEAVDKAGEGKAAADDEPAAGNIKAEDDANDKGAGAADDKKAEDAGDADGKPAGDKPQVYLSDIVHIRYSPTLNLAFQKQRPVRNIDRTVVVTARMNTRGEPEMVTKQFEELLKENKDAVALKSATQIPSNYFGSIIDQLVVWSDVRSTKGQHLALSPLQLDEVKAGVTLESWMALPWRGPEQIVMPGFQSDGGAGLRFKYNGVDLSLTTLGMMAAGTRTIVISRWAEGGKSTVELTRKFVEAMPELGVEESLRASRQAIRKQELNYEDEPRVRTKKTDPIIVAEHPFFWAGPMLLSIPDIRSQIAPPRDEPPAKDKLAEDDNALLPGEPGKMEDQDKKAEQAPDGKDQPAGQGAPENKETKPDGQPAGGKTPANELAKPEPGKPEPGKPEPSKPAGEKKGGWTPRPGKGGKAGR